MRLFAYCLPGGAPASRDQVAFRWLLVIASLFRNSTVLPWPSFEPPVLQDLEEDLRHVGWASRSPSSRTDRIGLRVSPRELPPSSNPTYTRRDPMAAEDRCSSMYSDCLSAHTQRCVSKKSRRGRGPAAVFPRGRP